ncbi:hypothetical protein PVAP13_2NG410303 [Panicum virgatum]|uniref:Uncharacterized protein n=1 Tax=Panicum virgatum TaxID=38727 RepID=A0A8T0VRW5_PANVG|nr:hypothetical protein PVAP13_2NG410303 [Panicum virgatum]
MAELARRVPTGGEPYGGGGEMGTYDDGLLRPVSVHSVAWVRAEIRPPRRHGAATELRTRGRGASWCRVKLRLPTEGAELRRDAEEGAAARRGDPAAAPRGDEDRGGRREAGGARHRRRVSTELDRQGRHGGARAPDPPQQEGWPGGGGWPDERPSRGTARARRGRATLSMPSRALTAVLRAPARAVLRLLPLCLRSTARLPGRVRCALARPPGPRPRPATPVVELGRRPASRAPLPTGRGGAELPRPRASAPRAMALEREVGTGREPGRAAPPGRESREERESGEEREKQERKKIKLTCGPHRHVVSTSAKPLTKTVRWLKMNGFES